MDVTSALHRHEELSDLRRISSTMGKRTETNQTDCDADFLFDQTHLDAGCLTPREDIISTNNKFAPIGSLLFRLVSALLITGSDILDTEG